MYLKWSNASQRNRIHRGYPSFGPQKPAFPWNLLCKGLCMIEPFVRGVLRLKGFLNKDIKCSPTHSDCFPRPAKYQRLRCWFWAAHNLALAAFLLIGASHYFESFPFSFLLSIAGELINLLVERIIFARRSPPPMIQTQQLPRNDAVYGKDDVYKPYYHKHERKYSWPYLKCLWVQKFAQLNCSIGVDALIQTI